MPRPAFRCKTEITLNCLRSSGTWLNNRDDIYISIEILGSIQRTRLLPPLFPAYVNDTLIFERTFWSPVDRYEVVEMLEDLPVSLEVRQVTDVYCGGTLLAYADTNARDLLFPYSADRAVNTGQELILTKTIDFPGVSARLEYSTYTIIEELTTPIMDSLEDSLHLRRPPPIFGRSSRSRNRESTTKKSTNGRQSASDFRSTRQRSPSPSGGAYTRKTLSSVMHSRSPSPTDRLRTQTRLSTSPTRSYSAMSRVENRPPFIVKKVSPSLLNRTPSGHDLLNLQDDDEKFAPRQTATKQRRSRPRSASPGRKIRSELVKEDKVSSGEESKEEIPPADAINRTRKERASESAEEEENDDDDLEVAANNTKDDFNGLPPRSGSAFSLQERYTPVADSYLERIKRRVDDAIWRNRYSYRLHCPDCWYTSCLCHHRPHHSYSYRHHHHHSHHHCSACVY